jgi:undecaprenyl diphosphate synthase
VKHHVAADAQFFDSSLFMTSSSSSPVPQRNGKEQKMNDDDDDKKKASSILPRHVAFVCDGNSRWAKARNLPAIMGHARGADRLVQVLKALLQYNNNQGRRAVSYCTMYGFSTENWARPAQEVADIFAVMEATVHKFYAQIMQQENLRFRILGDLDDDRIPASLREILQKLERETAHRHHDGYDDNDHNKSSQGQTLCVAINYGGRRDILQASKRLALQALAAAAKADTSSATAEAATTRTTTTTNGSTSSDADFDLDRFMTEEAFASLLCTAGIPDPDLIIRTSGEYRISNFLLWNAAYSELYFSEVFWPDFDETCLNQALSWYATRKRRFGSRQERDGGGAGEASAAIATQPQISSSS